MRPISLTCFVITSSTDNDCRAPVAWFKTKVREFGDHDGCCPGTSTVAVPPPAGTRQMLKSPICDVNAIHLPSGDQSGSVGFKTPEVGIRWTGPPPAGTLASARRSRIFVAKQIHCPSGDQHGDDWSSGELVNCRKSVPSALHT